MSPATALNGEAFAPREITSVGGTTPVGKREPRRRPPHVEQRQGSAGRRQHHVAEPLALEDLVQPDVGRLRTRAQRGPGTRGDAGGIPKPRTVAKVREEQTSRRENSRNLAQPLHRGEPAGTCPSTYASRMTRSALAEANPATPSSPRNGRTRIRCPAAAAIHAAPPRSGRRPVRARSAANPAASHASTAPTSARPHRRGSLATAPAARRRRRCRAPGVGRTRRRAARDRPATPPTAGARRCGST